MMNFKTIEEFEKDLKQLTKKYRSLPDDLETLKQVVLSYFMNKIL
jgi:mRNA-degrading endonuclease YafQ of YafQ-DinJ toxin-antitoxin module